MGLPLWQTQESTVYKTQLYPRTPLLLEGVVGTGICVTVFFLASVSYRFPSLSRLLQSDIAEPSWRWLDIPTHPVL